MSGRPYTMKEMKGILDYLVEHKAFGEVKGRKMWMDFANSQLTNRTWQSLKETFLKRILVDIHNPYYKLTVEQILSFRQGFEVEAREKDKLEIINVGDDSNSNSNAENDEGENAQPSTSHDTNGEAASGEDTKCSKVRSHDRASVDTVILTNFYETAEEVQKELESPTNSAKDNPPKSEILDHQSATKSLRDLITYSEPLTPMLQEVLNDSDSESDALRIVETEVENEPQNANEHSPIEIFDSEEIINKNSNNETDLNPKDKTYVTENSNDKIPNTTLVDSTSNKNAIDKSTDTNSTADESVEQEGGTENTHDGQPPKIMSLRLKKRKGKYKIETKEKKKSRSNKSSSVEPDKDVAGTLQPDGNNVSSAVAKVTSNAASKKDNEVSTLIPEKSTSLSNSADTIIPNNQEAFERTHNNTNTEKSVEIEVPKIKPPVKVNAPGTSKPRKRATSQDIKMNAKVKKTLLETEMKEKAVSDTDTIINKVRGKKPKVNFINIVCKDKTVNSKTNDGTKKDTTAVKKETQSSGDKSEFVSSTQSSQVNPCLKSVSLFAEQFNNISYVESDNEATTSGNKKNRSKTTNEKFVNVVNEVVILKSHSDSDCEPEKVSQQIKQTTVAQVKSQRDKALASIFGFSSGGVNTRRKKSMSYRKTSSYRYPRAESSPESSEWTSESDSEAYVSPPRGRKHRLSRKYLKPRSARILSLEEEGGLFVTNGKKIYTLVKDGKIIKNHLKYLPESDPEEEESYWKLKYVEERKRAEKFKRLACENEEKNIIREQSPILGNKSNFYGLPKKNANTNSGKEILPGPVKNPEEVDNNKGKTLKITFAKNNQEVHVEGHWSNIHPVLAEVVHLFNQDSAPAQHAPTNKIALNGTPSDASSEKSVVVLPSIVDKDVHEKVNKLETEIFKEIEKLDQEEEVETEAPAELNITTRKRPAKAKRSASNQSNTQNSPPNATFRSKRQKTDNATEKTAIENDKCDIDQKPIEEETTKSTQKQAEDGSLGSEHTKAEENPPEKKRVSGRLRKYSNQSKDSKESLNNTTEKATKKNEGPIKENARETRSSTGPIASTSKIQSPKTTRSSLSKRNIQTPKQTESSVSKNLSPKNNVSKGIIESLNNTEKNVTKTKIQMPNENEDGAANPTPVYRTSRRPKKVEPEPQADPELQPQASVSKVAPEPQLGPSEPNDEDTYLYRFPPAKKPSRRPALSKTRETKRYMIDIPKIYSSLNVSLHSESTQGYQDSDVSPPKSVPKRKRRLSLHTALKRTNHHIYRNKRKSYPLTANELLNDSSNTYPVVKPASRNSSLKSEEYRSESFQFLFPHKKAFIPLEKIDENKLPLTTNVLNREESLVIGINKDFICSSNTNTDGANSSNASLPLSPELSIVENLSISREFIINADNHPTLNEMQACDMMSEKEILNKYSLSQVDITMPLMQQTCGLQESFHKSMKIEPSFNEAKISAISESLIDKINVVNIKEASLSESLDLRLKNLLLESAKKMSVNPSEQDIHVKVQKKSKPGKRCSTPRKKKDVQKNKPKIIKPVIEEEYMETCSYGGRKSCPPVIQVIEVENIVPKDLNVNTEKETVKKGKGKKKKDVIKVKILRPKSKSPKKVHNCSVHDSGINETESVISYEGSVESVDLIHNHSDTCLQAHDCLPDSIEFIETTAKSIISLNTDTESSNTEFPQSQMFQDCDELPELFCQNAQDFSHVNKAAVSEKSNTDYTSDTVFHSPLLSDTSANSLITEDLSDEPPQSQASKSSKWYLLSEDDTNTNLPTIQQKPPSSFGSNLKQIFHLACAVPNLSTVTEGSESSRKPTLENDDSTRQDFDSQSMFNVNSC